MKNGAENSIIAERCRRRLSSAAAFALPLALATVLLSAPTARAQSLTEFRQPNTLELAYTGAAAEFEEPGLCEKISERALYRVRKPMLARSRCYYYIAINTADLSWCDEVRPIPAGVGVMNWLDPERCRYQVGRLIETGNKLPVAYARKVILRAMNYSQTDVPADYRNGAGIDWDGFFRAVSRSDTGGIAPEFKARLAKVPDFSSMDRAEDQVLYFTKGDEERELDWITGRGMRLCIQGRVSADCREVNARMRGLPNGLQEAADGDRQRPGANEEANAAAAGSEAASRGVYRRATEIEKARYDMALRLEKPDLCRKIGREVVAVGWTIDPGFTFMPLRSACLSAVARKTKTATLCDEVVSVDRDDLDSDGLNAAYCRRSVAGTADGVSRTTMRPDWPAVLQEIGFGIADIPEDLATDQPENVRWLAFADNVASSTSPQHATFVDRISRFQGPGGADDEELWMSEADLQRYLYQFTVIRYHCSINRYGEKYVFNGYDLSPPKKFGGPFSLIDHTGKEVTDESFRGRFLLVYFGYTYCPDVCPTNLAAISDALALLGDDGERVIPLFISVDARRDTVEQMAEYVTFFHPRLVGLTGSAEQIRRAAKAYEASYFAGDVDGEYVVDHTSWTYLVGPDGRPLTHFDHATDPKVMAAEIRNFIERDTIALRENEERKTNGE